jgi:hypothetical protein
MNGLKSKLIKNKMGIVEKCTCGFSINRLCVGCSSCHNLIFNTANTVNDANNLFVELYDKYVQIDDRFETVHIWSEKLAIKNNGKYTPKEISKEMYNSEKLHSWNK